MLFQQIDGFNSFMSNNWKGHLYTSVSELCFNNALGLLINNRSKNHSDFSRGAYYRSKICGDSSSKANYHLKNRADQNNRCHENAGKFPRNIVSSEMSLKSHKKPGNWKFVCITFAQYCTCMLIS